MAAGTDLYLLDERLTDGERAIRGGLREITGVQAISP
jgi:hypothetical protein